MIAVCRLRYCQRTRAYMQRRLAEGKTKREIIRCLKRYIARELYHALPADPLAQPDTPRPRDSILSDRLRRRTDRALDPLLTSIGTSFGWAEL